MNAKAKLSEIVDVLSFRADDHLEFLCLDTGEVHIVEAGLLSCAEETDDDDDEPPDIPDWQIYQWEAALQIVRTDRYLRLPSKFEINDWDIMRDFVDELDDGSVKEGLERAIHGRGAFRYFKDRVHEAGIEKEWYAFRDEALMEIARKWCRSHGLEWE